MRLSWESPKVWVVRPYSTSGHDEHAGPEVAGHPRMVMANGVRPESCPTAPAVMEASGYGDASGGDGLVTLAVGRAEVRVQLEQDAVGRGDLGADAAGTVVGDGVGQRAGGAAGIGRYDHAVAGRHGRDRGVEQADVGEQAGHDQVGSSERGHSLDEGRVLEGIQGAVPGDPVGVGLGGGGLDLGQVGTSSLYEAKILALANIKPAPVAAPSSVLRKTC